MGLCQKTKIWWSCWLAGSFANASNRVETKTQTIMSARFIILLAFCQVFLSGTLFSQMATSPQSGRADSFFFASKWQSASKEYEHLLVSGAVPNNVLLLNRLGFCYQNMSDYDKALEFYKKAESSNPVSPVMRQILFSRMAKSYAAKMDYTNSMVELQKAVGAGYINFEELDTALVYKKMQSRNDFKKLRDTAYYRAYPCMANSHAREFDFWVGEWDVYATGTKALQGHSVIQRVSGGCLILENWTSGGLPYDGKSMNFVDSTGKWQQVWVGASETSGPQIFINGEYKDNAMRFNFTTRAADGNTLKGRFIFFNQGANQVRQFQETSADDGKTWQTVYDFTYIRKK